ncbi:unnamed protein product [Nippostrongylus brasiliensis]|uniref:3-ketodihydrosphingosine reductase (inferred by orthology to a human protein) n=1 Tax=Nippostrongylus brasiliensis TaxID=27835 RepID=A0A158QZY3_NIPBR|nr:unnamed protein product [Nippostrongylus brasiliensis]
MTDSEAHVEENCQQKPCNLDEDCEIAEWSGMVQNRVSRRPVKAMAAIVLRMLMTSKATGSGSVGFLMTKKRSAIKADYVRLTVRIELSDTHPFNATDFELFIIQSVKRVLGTCGPQVQIGDYDELARRGSVIVAGEDAQLVMISPALALVLVAVVIVALIAFLVLYFSLPSRKPFALKGKHAVVTGGSKGIGKQLAVSLLSRGCHVSIVARNEKDLKAACEELQTIADQRGQKQEVRWYSMDLTKGYDEVESVIRKAEKELGPVDVLVNNAGGSVQDYEPNSWVSLPQRSSTFSFRGFADALQMELHPYNVNVSVLYPPNTDTEGFKTELATMPEELELISGTAGLFSPEYVAEQHVISIENGFYSTAIGLDGWMLNILTAGAAPERSMINALTQIMLAGLLRGVMLVYLGYFYGIVKKCYRRRKFEEEDRESRCI